MRRAALLLIPAVLLLPAAFPQQKDPKNREETQLPPGNGRELVLSSCNTSCHNLRVIITARKSRADWAKNVNDMIQRGAPVFPEEIEPITTYLAEVFGPSTPESANANGVTRKDEKPKPKDDRGNPEGRHKNSLKLGTPEKKSPQERTNPKPSSPPPARPTAANDSAIAFLPPKPLLRPGLLASSITSYSASSFLTEREATKNAPLPKGSGKKLVLNACTQCHTLEMTTTQRFTRAQWDSVVSEMVALGAHLKNDQVAMLVEYLAINFGEASTTPRREKRSSKTSTSSPTPHSDYR